MCKAVSRSFYSRTLNNSHTARARILRTYTQTARRHTTAQHYHAGTSARSYSPPELSPQVCGAGYVKLDIMDTELMQNGHSPHHSGSFELKT